MRQPTEITIGDTTLDVVLKRHADWRAGRDGGERAYLREAYLRWADLREADLREAELPHFQIADGDLIGWGKKGGHIVKLRIPADAKRTASLVGRKCRAEWVDVLEIEGADECHSSGGVGSVYRVGETVRPDSYDDDIRVECTHGIHFFQTRQEAEEW